MARPSPSPQTHKPRRRVNRNESRSPTPTPHRDVASASAAGMRSQRPSSSSSGGSEPAYPLAAFLWPARSSPSQWEVLPLILMAVGMFRWAAGLWGYSGHQRPPMYGDYEAQRHWMEITTQLPVSQWYFHDLEWWGLDYPPLTAYHSWLLGKIGALIDPSWFALYTSRGLEDPTLKVFMRGTVIVSEYLVYIPAAVIFVRRYSRFFSINAWHSSIALLAILMQPGTILIDHVHFQYNTVMLGLVLACMSSIMAGRVMWSCVFFVMALGFKQMALYYSPVIFAYLLGLCVIPRLNVPRFLGIAITTVASFALLLLPIFAFSLYDARRGITPRPELDGFAAPLPIFSEYSYLLPYKAWYFPLIQQSAQIVYRVFPFARGLFEDKVANFWCALNVVIKLRKYPAALLQRASLLGTMAAITPPSVAIFLRPRKELLPLALATSAWGFFLFSFQVHEKSVLLPLMPMTFLLAGYHGMGKNTRAWVGFANILGCWTMFPLLQRVDLRIPYFVLTLLWAYLLGLPPTSLSVYHFDSNASSFLVPLGTAVLHLSFYAAMVAWHFLEAFVRPPTDKPDLWVVVNVGIGAAGFGLCYVWCLWKLLEGSFGLTPKNRTGKEKLAVKKSS
ncbi:glycosyltransferase family 57 protein [Xylogone sp. PMI_703]|nr:glycosyltransferase family 57 protein [Xylogone sp. PMI_703]